MRKTTQNAKPPGRGLLAIRGAQRIFPALSSSGKAKSAGKGAGIFDDQVSNMDSDDPRAPYIGVYQWLAYLQETLVRALS
jgi:hypothetical protein